MRLRNSSGLPTKTVRQVLAFVRPPGIAGFDVMTKKSSYRYGGTAYSRGSGYHMSASPFIVVRVGPDKLFPFHEITKKSGYLPAGWIYSRVEALVLVMAHELRHLWQAKHKYGRVWGSRGQMSERDADAYALHMLRTWRRANGIVRTKTPGKFPPTAYERYMLRQMRQCRECIEVAQIMATYDDGQDKSWMD